MNPTQESFTYCDPIFLQVSQLFLMCLVVTRALVPEDWLSRNASQVIKHSAMRRPIQYLQPHQSPKVMTPLTQRHSSTRLRSVSFNGPHSSPKPTAYTRDTISRPSGNKQHMNPTNVRASNQSYHNPRFDHNPSSFSAHSRLAGREGKPVIGESSKSEGQRISRWLMFPHGSQEQRERNPDMNNILRPPPLPHRDQSSPQKYQPVQSSVDQAASGTHQHHAFVPYNSSPRHKLKTTQCNQCNKTPWIPMVTSHHGPSDAVNGHVPRPNIYLPPATISSGYESPPIGSLPLQSHGTEYGPPLPPLDTQNQYEPPSHSEPTNEQYAVPNLSSVHLGNEYGPPHSSFQHIQPEYKPPHPATEYGLPHQLTDEYGPPPPLPQQTHNHFQQPPSAASHQGIQYGPPSIITIKKPDYGPPILSPLSVEYGAPSHPIDTDYRSPSPPADQYGTPQHDGLKQQVPHQLSPIYLQAPPVFEPEWFKAQSQSAASHYLVPPPNSGGSNADDHGHSSGERGQGGGTGQTDIDVVQSVSLTDDSHPVASQHPTSDSHDGSSSHLFQNSSHLPNNQFYLPEGENYAPPENNYPFPNIPRTNATKESGYEIIPSVQVTDYISSIEYPLHIVQSPYIDVTEAPGNSVKQITQQQNYDNHGSAQSSNSYDQGEIIIGKPALTASGQNNTNIQNSYNTLDTVTQNVSDIRDQKHQQSQIHETNSLDQINGGKPSLDLTPTSPSKPLSTDNAYFGIDDQIHHPDINVFGEHGIRQESSQNEHSSSDFEIHPSIQTSAEGNSVIHQINNAFQSDIRPTTESLLQKTILKSHNSGYVLFQNFPEPPLSSLPENVLKQQIPPPTPFQNTFQQNPYLPPLTSSNTFEHSLKTEETASFLSPPPKDNGEYNTVINTATPEYTFWTPTSLPHSVSLSPEIEENSWELTTQKPSKHYNQGVISAFAEAAGLLPPPPSLPEPLNQSNKKPKQIQIIVPYTSSKELMKFKFQDTSKPLFDTSGWFPLTGNDEIKQQGRKAPSVPSLHVNCTGDERSWQLCKNITSPPWQDQIDYHQHQESRTVEAKTSILQTDKEITRSYPDKNKTEIQQVFTTNIRDLLRGEQDIKVPDYITLQRLQKNIDEWTALEYSKWKSLDRSNESKNLEGDSLSTLSPSSGNLFQHLFVPSKKIPEEYLTTTPSHFDDVTSTENSVATSIPVFKQSRISTAISNAEPYSGSKTHPVLLSSSGESDYSPKINHDIPLNHQRKGDNHKWKFIESNNIIPEALRITTKETFSATTTPLTEDVTNTEKTTWDNIPLSISPVTNEKVYIVTPMTNWIPESTTSTPFQTTPYSTKTHSTSINDVFPFRNGPPSAQKLVALPPLSFKSPRFIIRPAPASSIQRSYILSPMENDSDTWDDKTATSKPIKLNKINGNTGKIIKEYIY